MTLAYHMAFQIMILKSAMHLLNVGSILVDLVFLRISKKVIIHLLVFIGFAPCATLCRVLELCLCLLCLLNLDC
jgi:hypothetical protein